jgi:hypothetical protein
MKNSYILLSFLLGILVAGVPWLLTSYPHVPKSSASVSAISYNCELSGGEFTNGQCLCPTEDTPTQTEQSMYDPATGFCQSTMGGAASDAFNASLGLPYGTYDYYFSIVEYHCAESGGNFLNARCDCGNQTYNDTTGQCQ